MSLLRTLAMLVIGLSGVVVLTLGITSFLGHRHEHQGTVTVAHCRPGHRNSDGVTAEWYCTGSFAAAAGGLVAPRVTFTSLNPLDPGTHAAASMARLTDTGATLVSDERLHLFVFGFISLMSIGFAVVVIWGDILQRKRSSGSRGGKHAHPFAG